MNPVKKPTMTRVLTAALALTISAAAATALAQAPGRGEEMMRSAVESRRAAVLQDVVDCRRIAESAQRLACFDAAAARLDEAASSGAVVVVDREQVQQARREIFGFSVPSFDLFGGGEGRAAPPPIENVEAVIEAYTRGGDGRLVLTLENGQVWRQIDGETASARRGATVRIRRAALGSYLANIDGQIAIRVRRVQ